MANRYWLGGSGTWDATTTTHWSTTSGGTGGASVPTSSDAVILDNNSASGSFTIEVGGTTAFTANALSFDASALTSWAGIVDANNAPGSGNTANKLQIVGNVNYGNKLTLTSQNNSHAIWNITGTSTLTQGSSTSYVGVTSTTALTLGSVVNMASLFINSGTFNTNNYNMTLSGDDYPNTLSTSSGTTNTFGTSTIISGGSGYISLAGTISAASAYLSVGCAGSGYNGVTGTWGTVVLPVSTTIAIQLYNSFTANTLALTGIGIHRISLYPGITITTSNLVISGTSSNLTYITTGTPGTPATINSSTSVNLDYMSIKDSTAAGTTPFYAGTNSTNVSGNTGWTFTSGIVAHQGLLTGVGQ